MPREDVLNFSSKYFAIAQLVITSPGVPIKFEINIFGLSKLFLLDFQKFYFFLQIILKIFFSLKKIFLKRKFLKLFISLRVFFTKNKKVKINILRKIKLFT